MTFFDHLEELRWHIMRSVIAIVLVGIVLFIYRIEVLGTIFLWPFKGNFPTYKLLCWLSDSICVDGNINVLLQATSPYEQFVKALVYAFFGGLIITLPYILWELWRFIKPALGPKEVKAVRWNVAFISLLFFVGGLFGYFVVLPFSIQFLSTFQLLGPEVQNQWRIGEVVNLILMLILGTGALFQFPVIMYYLAKLGIISSAFLSRYRKHSVVVILVIAGIVTPPDPFSQTILAIPMYGLFELSIFIIKRVERNKAIQEEIENARYAKPL